MNIGSAHAMSGKFEVETLSVVLAQIAPISAYTYEDVDKNVDQLLDWMEGAASRHPGYDLFVSPECGLQGFSPKWTDVMLDLDGPEIQRLRDKCRALGVYGIFNPILKELDGKKACNTAIMINDQGEIVHTYVKMNPWSPGEQTYPGWSCPVTPGPKGSRIATIICADGDYPEIWREAAYNGANIIVRVSHYMTPWDRAWEITNKAGAYFNQIYVVGCNSVDIEPGRVYFGKSMVVNPDGTIITDAPMGVPWLVKADLYPQIIDHMRKEQTASNLIWTYRHRGISHPDLAGTGADLSQYNAYRQEG